MFYNFLKISFVVFGFSFFISSCSPYQRALKSDDTSSKYAFVDSLYQIGKYKKTLKLMEQIVPAYRGKPQAEKLMYMYANTFYKLEDFYLAGYQFERFATSYPQSDSAEVASFKSASSYFELSPRYSLEQKDTKKGLEKLQEFINKYPNSKYRKLANEKVNILTDKLEYKEIQTAKQYLKIAEYRVSYKNAIEAFDNFINDYPGSKYRKEAYLGKIKAAYELAIRSLPSLVEERLLTAKTYYDNFIKYYGDDELKLDADELLEKINKRLTKQEISEL